MPQQTFRVSYEMRFRGRKVYHKDWICKGSQSAEKAIESAKKHFHKWYSSVNQAFEFSNFTAKPYIEPTPTPALRYFEDES